MYINAFGAALVQQFSVFRRLEIICKPLVAKSVDEAEVLLKLVSDNM